MTPSYTKTSELTAGVLLRELMVELQDVEYFTRTHGKPSTYRAGCKGHLCRYAERTRRRVVRAEEVEQSLPTGVIPEVRPRREQNWDLVLASVVNTLNGRPHEANLDMKGELGRRLGVDEITRYVALHELILKRRVYVPAQRSASIEMK
ncbi:hypothetical protein AB0F25_30445 [Streptomyces wedmorensis]|uniref:hypothetical protein n=1 Tax=Streptomyces wedmorensis TaxID=43759 RepID=UPI003429CE09